MAVLLTSSGSANPDPKAWAWAQAQAQAPETKSHPISVDNIQINQVKCVIGRKYKIITKIDSNEGATHTETLTNQSSH